MEFQQFSDYKLQPRVKYSWGDLRKIICPTQSSTADNLIMDYICQGRLQELNPECGKRLFRINQ